MRIAPDGGATSVRVLGPKSGEETVPVTSRGEEALTGDLNACAVRRLPEGEWLTRNGKPAPTTGFEIECAISAAGGANGKVLLLLQFPGREHRPSLCRATVNGQPTVLRESSSENRIGYMEGVGSKWKEVLPHQSNWHWYIAEMGSGTSSVKFTGACAAPECRIGVWAWSEHDTAQTALDIAIECPEPQLPPYRETIERRGICLRRPS